MQRSLGLGKPTLGMGGRVRGRLQMSPICQAHSRQTDRVEMGTMPIVNYPMPILGMYLIGPFVPSPGGC